METKVCCAGCKNNIPSNRAYWEVKGLFFCDKKCWLKYKEAENVDTVDSAS